MRYHIVASEEDEHVWKQVMELAGTTFTTAKGLEFSYHIKRNRQGELLGELVFDRKKKTITRATLLLAYQKARELQRAEGCVSGPKRLGVFGASYLYPIFLRMGVCSQSRDGDPDS